MRTLDLTSVPGSDEVSFHLLLGDGSARAVSACVVFMAIMRSLASMPRAEPSVEHLVRSLMSMTVSFELHGSGSNKESLLAQCSRQNQAAAVQPVSTLQWISMVSNFTNVKLGQSFGTTSQLQQSLEQLINDYNKHAEAQAYDVDVAHRKRRRVNRSTAEEDPDTGLKIGRRRLVSMKMFIAGATDLILQMLTRHVTVVGDAKTSILSDDLLQCKAVYVNSKLSKEHLPSAVDILAHDMATSSMLVDEGTQREIHYDAALSTDQAEMLWSKMIYGYESAISGMESAESKVKCKPSVADAITARRVVQFCDDGIAPVAKADMSTDDFAELGRIILQTTQLDAELVSLLDRMPKYFNLNMIPSIAQDDQPTVDVKAKKLVAAIENREQAVLDVFLQELASDWESITRMRKGSDALAEMLVWMAGVHRRRQAQLGTHLVELYCKEYFPTVVAASWDKLPSAVAVHTSALPAVEGSVKSMVIVDFNVPGARDALKLNGIVAAAAEICKIQGSHTSILVAFMPSMPKEGSTTSPDDDEVQIRKVMQQHGFKTDMRVRSIIDMPASICNKVHAMEWFVDGRLCCQGDANDNVWLLNSEVARTRIIRDVAVLPDPDALVDLTSLDPDEDLNTGVRYPTVAMKCAQRGVDVAAV